MFHGTQKKQYPSHVAHADGMPCARKAESMVTKNHLVVGVLGGMGSYSTLHFFEQLLDAFDVTKEWERPRIIIDNNCVLPSRVIAIVRGEGRVELVAGMASSIDALLRYGPNLIVIPCHTAHCFLTEVRALRVGADRILDMIDAVTASIEARGLEGSFLLATEGTIATGVYGRYGSARSIEITYPCEAQQRTTRRFIEQIKQRRGIDGEGFVEFIEGLGQPTVILGCTELSVLYSLRPRDAEGVTVLDPLNIVIERIQQASRALEAAHPERAERPKADEFAHPANHETSGLGSDQLS